ncbi:MAG: hypothetical protein SH817_08555 [Leptospira sp.]|nr:hypothetical protein [Leptospira sp.]
MPEVILGTGKEGEELVELKDPKSDTVYKIPKELNAVIGAQIAGVRVGIEKTAKEEYSKKLADLTAKLTEKEITLQEFQTELTTLQNSTLPEAARKEKEAEKKIKDFEKKVTESETKAQTSYNLFRSTKIDNDLMGAFSDPTLEVYSPSQALALLKAYGSVDLVEADGTFKTIVKLKVGEELLELTPKEAAEKFINLPENVNLKKNSLSSGAGSGSGTKVGNATVFSNKDWAVKISSAKPDERKQLLMKASRGEIVVKD